MQNLMCIRAKFFTIGLIALSVTCCTAVALAPSAGVQAPPNPPEWVFPDEPKQKL